MGVSCLPAGGGASSAPEIPRNSSEFEVLPPGGNPQAGVLPPGGRRSKLRPKISSWGLVLSSNSLVGAKQLKNKKCREASEVSGFKNMFTQKCRRRHNIFSKSSSASIFRSKQNSRKTLGKRSKTKQHLQEN